MDFTVKQNVKNPAESAGILSKLFSLWILPLMRQSNKVNLELNNIYNCLEEDGSQKLAEEIETSWTKIRSIAEKKHTTPKLYRAFLNIYMSQSILVGFCVIVSETIVRVGQLIYLKLFIESFSSDRSSDANLKLNQYYYGAALSLTTLLNTIINKNVLFTQNHIGMKIGIAASALIYRKALRLRKGEGSVGKIVNFLSNDVEYFKSGMNYFHYLYVAPIQTPILLYLLWREIGVASLFGGGVLILFILIQCKICYNLDITNYFIATKFKEYRQKIAVKSDERSRIINEIIHGIRLIKMYAWEHPFSKIINLARKNEVKILRRINIFQSAIFSLNVISFKLIIFLIVVGSIFMDGLNVLEPQKMFFAYSVCDILYMNNVAYFPMGVRSLAEILVAFDRIEKFLLEDEISALKSEGNDLNQTSKSESCSQKSIKIIEACAEWDDNIKTLDNINLRLEGDKLIIICGQVGSGKSSFLNMLISELKLKSGSIKINGSLTYASQDPWIFTGNVRQNILFGEEYDESKYKEIIHVCALEPDFEQLPFGDRSIVGERGVILSGGQKARVNLARALYHSADIVLLDDPLSAVDSGVSRHIFEKCIKGYLKNKMRILVTHQLQYLGQADYIIVLNEGKVIAEGEYEELIETGNDFVKLILSGKENEDDSNEIENKSSSSAKIWNEADKPDDKNERMSVGVFGVSIYWEYFKSGGSILSFIFILSFYILQPIAYCSADIWLSKWTNDEELRSKTNATSHLFLSFELNQNFYIIIYSGLTFLLIVFTILRDNRFYEYTTKISQVMHDKLFSSIVRAPTKFFDNNSSGRILNRFTKDLGSIDRFMPFTFFHFSTSFLLIISQLIVIIIQNYYMVLPTFAILTLFFFIRQFYIKTSVDIKRIESITKSPIYTHLSASMHGIATIRTSNVQKKVIQQYDSLQDSNTAANFINIVCNTWLALWPEIFSIILLTALNLSYILFASDSDGGTVGLAISASLKLTGVIQRFMLQSAETENLMTSVERVIEYSKLQPEAPLDSEKSKKPVDSWPKEGQIQFNHVSLSYDSTPVLNDLNFIIGGNDKIGVVGRTGAGKTSLVSALLRMTEINNGKILIDGIDISTIGLHDLRKVISIIPQDPVLFSGTLRHNLDPFSQFKDIEIWNALKEVGLKDGVISLSYIVTENGGNFSVGKRQLMCLARAILKNSKIIIMDEVTANVDPKTDAFIQKTIRNKFKNCTIITIAHRLNSVMDCDKILVLETGKVLEFESPYLLLQNPKSALFSMVEKTGSANSEKLREISSKAYQDKLSAESKNVVSHL